MTKKLRLFFLGLLFCFGIVSVMAQQDRTFSWTLGLQYDKTGELVSFTAPVKSSTGERFIIVINPTVNCHCYIVVESMNGNDAGILYSGPLKGGEIWHSIKIELMPPQGTESFFIVLSRTEQKNLVQRIQEFNNNSGSMQKRALMNEIFSIRNEVSRFKEAPEKPMLIGGVDRGNPEKSRGLEFSGLETYVKTISIEH